MYMYPIDQDMLTSSCKYMLIHVTHVRIKRDGTGGPDPLPTRKITKI